METVLNNTFGGIIGFIKGAFILGVFFLGPIIHYQLCKRKPEKTLFYTLILIVFNPLFILLSLFLSGVNFSKRRYKVYDNVAKNPNDTNIDDLMHFIDKYGCDNSPNAWHQLRGLWYAVNENSNVSTNKKKELKIFLMTKGLFLHKEESEIIDNFSK